MNSEIGAIRAATLYRLAMPMKAAFAHSRATHRRAENLVLHLEGADWAGLGECVPRDYVTGETPASTFAAIASLDLGNFLRAFQLEDYNTAALAIEAELSGLSRLGLAGRCTVELALLDALGRRFGQPMRSLAAIAQIAPTRPTARGTVLALNLEQDPRQLLAEKKNGITHLKVKVDQRFDRDFERLSILRDLLGPSFTICVDANMAWSLNDACSMVERLRGLDIAWYEEPLPQRNYADYRELRRRTGAKVMLDESLCSIDDGRRAIEESACDLFNLRVSKCGGFIGSLRLAELADRHRLAVQVGSHIGTMGVLEAAGRHLVNAVETVAYEGGATVLFFQEEIVKESLEPDLSTGLLADLSAPGLGVSPRLEVIERHCVQRAHWSSTDRCWRVEG